MPVMHRPVRSSAGSRDAKADVMLVPRDNLDELRDMDTGDLELIPVSTFDEAVEALSSSEPAT